MTRQCIVLTFTADIRAVPRSLIVNSQALSPGKAIGDIAGVAVVLYCGVKVEGGLLRQGRMTGVLDRWRLETVDWKMLISDFYGNQYFNC